MKRIIAFLKLIRINNLLMIALIMCLVRYCLLAPMVEAVFQNVNITLHLQMSGLNFFLLCLSAVFIAAAGYAINDYFDIRIDRINKPGKIIVGRLIKRRVAMGLHIVLNIVGLLLGAWVSYISGLWKLTGIHLFAILSLWFYSTNFKRKLLLGNIIIALLAALVPLLPALYEIPMLGYAYFKILRAYGANFNFIMGWVLAYAVFAFLLTLAREITKDIIDKKGDETTGCMSVPIGWGNKKAGQLICAIYIICLALVFYLWEQYVIGDKTYTGDLIRFDAATFMYLFFFVFAPLIWLIYKTVTATKLRDYTLASRVNKFVVISGVLYMLIAWYTITRGLMI